MIAVIQRVSSARVEVNGAVVSEIGPGVLTLLGVQRGDTREAAEKLIKKIVALRIFEDDAGKMNLSLSDFPPERRYSHLIVSQFTLAADCSQGRRPSFGGAESPERAQSIYEHALEVSKGLVATQAGRFQANMKITLVNDGPATFVL